MRTKQLETDKKTLPTFMKKELYLNKITRNAQGCVVLVVDNSPLC